MLDCLKWRDTQIDNKLKSLIPLRSTLIHPAHSSILPSSVSQGNNQTYWVPPSHTQMSVSGIPSAVSLVKIEFQNFNSSENDDPVTFIERCEEYLAIRPLSDYEILASLTSVLKNTAKVGGWKEKCKDLGAILEILPPFNFKGRLWGWNS